MVKAGSSIELDTGKAYLDMATDETGTVNCVFSTNQRIKVGTGTTTRRHVSKLFWYVEQISEQEFAVRQINENHVPSGEEFTISLQELLSEYTPEVEVYEQKALPAMQFLQEHVDAGEDLRKDGKLYSAENCVHNALMIDDKNVRSLFNLGLIYLEFQNEEKARDMMREILKINAAFRGKNQFLFNEFGIALRKAGMLDDAVDYYGKAAEFAPEDEHLLYNLARAHYERGDWVEMGRSLVRCRALNPELKAARDLARLVEQLHDNPQLCAQHGKPPVPAEVLAGLQRSTPKPHPSFYVPESDYMLESDSPSMVKRARGEAEADLDRDIDDEPVKFDVDI